MRTEIQQRVKFDRKQVQQSRRMRAAFMLGFLCEVLPIKHRFCGQKLEHVWYATDDFFEILSPEDKPILLRSLRALADLETIIGQSPDNAGLLAAFCNRNFSRSERQQFIEAYPFGQAIAHWAFSLLCFKNIVKAVVRKNSETAACFRSGEYLGVCVTKFGDNFKGEGPDKYKLRNCVRQLPRKALRMRDPSIRALYEFGFRKHHTVLNVMHLMRNEAKSDNREMDLLPPFVGYRSMCEWLYLRILKAFSDVYLGIDVIESRKSVALATNAGPSASRLLAAKSQEFRALQNKPLRPVTAPREVAFPPVFSPLWRSGQRKSCMRALMTSGNGTVAPCLFSTDRASRCRTLSRTR
jgi:hypothetical protein